MRKFEIIYNHEIWFTCEFCGCITDARTWGWYCENCKKEHKLKT